MTDYQNELVMEHLDLVNWVIRTRISVPNRPLLTYDDFYAIGCEAICRAALKYQADSGEFAPFACRYCHPFYHEVDKLPCYLGDRCDNPHCIFKSDPDYRKAPSSVMDMDIEERG